METLLQAVREQISRIEEEAESFKEEEPFAAGALHRIARDLKMRLEGWEKQVASKDQVGDLPKELLS